MKRLLLASLTLVCGAIHAQVFTDGKGLTVRSKLFRMDKPKLATKPVHMTLNDHVIVLSEPQGLNLTSDRMTLNALPVDKPGKGYRIHDAVATGHVVVVKTAVSKAGKQVTRVEGPDATYSAGIAESVVKMNGEMHLKEIDESGKPTLDASGQSGSAYFEPLKQTKLDNALHKATMDGNVHLTLTQYDPKSKTKTTVKTASDHMQLEVGAEGRRVTLTGSVHIETDGLSSKGFERAVFLLSKDGDIKFETSVAK